MKKSKEGFKTNSNYPCREYILYLEYQISKLAEMERLNSKDKAFCSAIAEQIWNLETRKRRVEDNAFHYNVMDLMYAGEKEAASNFGNKVIQYCELCLQNPVEDVKRIYVEFAMEYNIPKAM